MIALIIYYRFLDILSVFGKICTLVVDIFARAHNLKI